MPSPTCTIGGVATPVDVTAGSTVNGALASPAGALYWSLVCTATDESNTAAAINATLSVNQGAKTFSFTAPGVGSSVICTSTVGVKGLGLDANGVWQPSFSTTFKVNVKAGNGLRVLAFNELLEQSSFGWLSELNAGIRSAGGGTATVTGTGFAHVTSSSFDSPARAVNLNSADVTGVAQVANGGTGLSAVGPNGQVLTVVSGVPAWSSPTSGSAGPIRFPITTTATQNSITTIPGGSLVTRVAVRVTSAFSGGTTIQIGNSTLASLLMATGTIDTSLATPGLYDLPLDVLWGSSTLPVQVSIGGSPSLGAGYVLVLYGAPTT
jgi:hypothetical protein